MDHVVDHLACEDNRRETKFREFESMSSQSPSAENMCIEQNTHCKVSGQEANTSETGVDATGCTENSPRSTVHFETTIAMINNLDSKVRSKTQRYVFEKSTAKCHSSDTEVKRGIHFALQKLRQFI